MLFLSLLAIGGKELLDSEISINDLASDALGFFLGTALVFDQVHRKKRRLRQVPEKEVAGQSISLRSTLALIETIERRSADFYLRASAQLPNQRASGICFLLSQDASRRADRVTFTLSSLGRRNEPEEFSTAVETAFSSHHIFSLDFSPSSTAREVLEIALAHEKKKLSLFSKLEAAFHEEWKQMRLERVLDEISKEIQKLELCLAELDKESAVS